MKNNIVFIIITGVISFGIGFFGGITYQKSKPPPSFISRGRQDFQRGVNQRFGGFRPINGEIIKKDNESIIVKLKDGSTRIVLLTKKTNILKSTQGLKNDLKEKSNVFIIGQENSDGSITAENIQVGRINFVRDKSQ